MNHANPLISVIIPTYKRPTYLARAIDSALNQNYDRVEIIVVDDNDAESEGRALTEKVMEKYSQNPCVTYIKHEVNKNGSAARNTGFKHAQGEYVAFLDDDDEFLPEKLSSQLECLQGKDSSFGACYSNYLRVNENGKLVDICKENREGYLHCEALKRNIFAQAGSNLLIKREFYEKINGFDESFQRNQDIEFMARLFEVCQVAYCETMGLKIYLNSTGKKRVDFVELTNQYKGNFAAMIGKLDENEQREIYKMLDVQVLRHILLNKKSFKETVAHIKKSRLNLLYIIKYFCYLVNRKLTKTAYGFKG